MESGEYSQKKTVRNAEVVRELDETRQRELWRSVAVCLVIVLLLLGTAWQHFERLQLGYRVEQLREERSAEEEINRHLRLEIGTLRAPKRIEGLAIRELNLVAPGPNDAVVIERVTPSAPPPKSVVAMR